MSLATNGMLGHISEVIITDTDPSCYFINIIAPN